LEQGSRVARRGYDENERAMAELLGVHFRTLREARGWSIRAAAKRANMARQSLAMIESGRGFPVWSTAFRLASVYGVRLASVAALIDDAFGYGEEAA
jgi:transcriptional regulator with XRE-family HTH domain